MTMNQTATQLQKNLDRIREKNESRLSAIREKIDRAEAAGRDPSALYRQLDQARRTAQAGESLAERTLQAAQERESAQAQEQAARHELARAEIDAKMKANARHNWQKNGGTAAEFDAAWPGLREEIIKERTLEASARELLREVNLPSL